MPFVRGFMFFFYFFGRKMVLTIKKVVVFDSIWGVPPHFLGQFPRRWPILAYSVIGVGVLNTCALLSVANIRKPFRISCYKMSWVLFQYILLTSIASIASGECVSIITIFLVFAFRYALSRFLRWRVRLLMYVCTFSSIATTIPPLVFSILQTWCVVFFVFWDVFCSVCSSSIVVFNFRMSLIADVSFNA